MRRALFGGLAVVILVWALIAFALIKIVHGIDDHGGLKHVIERAWNGK